MSRALLNPALVAAMLAALTLAGCADSHPRFDDGSVPSDGAMCAGSSTLFCVSACGSDAGLPPVCTAEGWRCPAGTIDSDLCPPGCSGAPPPDCVCRGTRWVCEDPICPDDVDPWDPSNPANACSVEGATCTGGSTDSCGPGLFCTCESGLWSCAVAEPDPVCWCGREPSEGDRCSEEGSVCGECCPTLGGTGWAAMECVGGHWTSAACPDVECPALAAPCPVDTASQIGRTCGVEGQSCGDVCCGTGIDCRDGVWQRGPEVACACHMGVACGGGTCTQAQSCQSGCGPDDGIEYSCLALPEGCRSCECLTLREGQACEMIEGHPHVRELGFCG